ncbi:MAG: prepilin-type N-terminal cleavage/methylation domain-containing protein [Bacilli bacterium]
MKNFIKNESGFTLFETIVVLAVIAIFVGTMTEVMIVSNRLLVSYNENVNNRSDAALAIAHMDTSLKKYDAEGAVMILQNKIAILTSDPGSSSQLYLVYYNPPTQKDKLYVCSTDNLANEIDITGNTCNLLVKDLSTAEGTVPFNVSKEHNNLTNTTKVTLQLITTRGEAEIEDKRVVTLKTNQ